MVSADGRRFTVDTMTEEHYTDDPTEVREIDTYETTEDGRIEFLHAYCRAVWPEDDDGNKQPADELGRYAFARETAAFDELDPTYSNSDRLRVAEDGHEIMFTLPGWLADEKFGHWSTAWFANLEVAKLEDGELKALCVSDAEPLSDVDEDDYFREPVADDTWLPGSMLEEAMMLVEPTPDGLLQLEQDEDGEVIQSRGQPEEDHIYLTHQRNTQYGYKIAFDTPYEAKDDIDALDWEKTHHSWSGNYWLIDTDASWYAVRELLDAGWTVTVDDTLEANAVHRPLDKGNGGLYLPEVQV